MSSGPISLVAVGDICLGMGVGDSVRQFGPDFPFAPCSRILHKADLVFGNLEMVFYNPKTPLIKERCFQSLMEAPHPFLSLDKGSGLSLDRGSGKPGPFQDYAMSHLPLLDFKAPLAYGQGLARAGFRLLSAANNHIMDFGFAACQDTLYFLKEQGIMTAGCGRNLAEARKPAILTMRGKRIGLLAYADNSGQFARPGQAGVAPIKKKYLLEDIKALRPQVDILVVSLHADLEFVAYPAPWRVRLSRRLIEAGADVILQHHPHVPQGIERYREGLIAYSLGSFVFPIWGNSYAQQRPYTDQSLILNLHLDRHRILGYEIWPVRINAYHQPLLMEGEDRQEFLRYLRAISLPLGRPDLLNRLWAKSCRQAASAYCSWLKGIYWREGWPGVFRQIALLAKSTEKRRWVLGLVPGLGRFGF